MSVNCGNLIQFFLALLTSSGFFGGFFYLLTYGYPEHNKDMINVMLSVLGTIWTLQMNYFFGSSSSGKSKDDTIAVIASAAATTTGTGSGNRAGDRAAGGTGGVNIPNADKVDITVNNPPPDPATPADKPADKSEGGLAGATENLAEATEKLADATHPTKKEPKS